MAKLTSFFGLSKAPESKTEAKVDARTEFQKMIDREILEVNIEMEFDSDVEGEPTKPLPICAICKKDDKHEHDECLKKYNPMDRGYYDEEGAFIEFTPPEYFVKEVQRLMKDPGFEGQHYRALQAYKKSASQVELYLAAKQEKYGESAKGDSSDSGNSDDSDSQGAQDCGRSDIQSEDYNSMQEFNDDISTLSEYDMKHDNRSEIDKSKDEFSVNPDSEDPKHNAKDANASKLNELDLGGGDAVSLPDATLAGRIRLMVARTQMDDAKK